MEFERETIYLRFLFSLFLNDLETFLEDKYVTGLESISGDLENQLNIYLKLFIMLMIRQTVSKSFIKSTNAQYIFFFLLFRISKKILLITLKKITTFQWLQFNC
jgi:hypothetical protein